ncbi:uncharacterized protein EI90DRAFT_3046566 [Cantharellus anzutake]|uniref:uncharacterized protein n=1 Tax=Cantharellus anzutake TaxID=1750568 RepID=UPI001903BB84|nr:uncharacterized protein EI90DRAFT_3046566 [Cantharellus anzutake]KAF8336633.1 hypothetical protein EI90DRAFT_3046566 [Cantharellus anzutake]
MRPLVNPSLLPLLSLMSSARRHLHAVVAAAIVCCFLLLTAMLRLPQAPSFVVPRTVIDNAACPANDATPRPNLRQSDGEQSLFRQNLTVFSHPTLSFRDNLWSDKNYITTWGSAGFTNDFMAYMNLIYLAMMTDRIPIIPPPSFSHHVDTREKLYFNQVFNVSSFSASLKWPILDWSEVKTPESEHPDIIGCWSTWERGAPEKQPRWSSVTEILFIDPSYTTTPTWASFGPPGWPPRISAVSSLAYPQGRQWALENEKPVPSRHEKHELLPDEHLFCMDYIFYAGLAFPKDMFGVEWSPGWRNVARHAHFNEPLLEAGRRYIRRLFGTSEEGTTPHFIAVHIRRQDFESWCGDGAADDCLAPPSAYHVRVKEVQEELLTKKGIHVEHVVFSSDDKDSSLYWKEVELFGWRRLALEDDDAEMDLRRTLGSWTSTIMDAAIQSLAIGFVGTELSTFSLLSTHRVEEWNGGVTRGVKWGQKGADEH